MTDKKKEAKTKKVKVKSHVRKISSNKKKTPSKRKTKKRTPVKRKTVSEKKVDSALINNFVMIQKVMVNLSTKLDSLSTQISKLLELFEITAKSFAVKDFKKEEDEESKKILKKLDNISQQAGLIGKGLALIHEIGSEVGDKNQFQPKPTNFIPQRMNLPPLNPPQRMQNSNQMNQTNQNNNEMSDYSLSGKNAHGIKPNNIENSQQNPLSQQDMSSQQN